MDVVDIRHITIEAAEVVEVIVRDLRTRKRIAPNQVLQSIKLIGEHRKDDWSVKLYFVKEGAKT